jgi:hypothetical protein
MTGKWLAAILLGLPLSTGVVGLAALLWPGRLEVHTLPLLLLSFPVWAAVLAYAALYAAKALGWAAELPA